jgi:RNA polymerase sigma factor (TIGR02999 family)
MPASSNEDLTRLLHDWSNGKSDVLPRLMDLVYPELYRIAARHLRGERRGHTLQATALVSEAYVRLAQHPGKPWADRTHFFAVAARVIRAVLVDHARARRAAKRGFGMPGVTLGDVDVSVTATPIDVLDLDSALVDLQALNAQHSRIVELRYFAGLSIEETAEALGTSPASVKRGWIAAKTFIRRRLDQNAVSA